MTLACEDVSLVVSGRTLCHGLAFAVRPGEVWGVLGANGSGKTTLLNVLAGLAVPARGRVTLAATPLRALVAQARARAIGLLPQQEHLEFWGTVLDYVQLGRFPHASAWPGRHGGDEAAALGALRQMGLADFAPRRYTTLSGGERQRVRMAQLLAQAPDYLLLDEPLQHLDLRHQQHLLARVAELARGPHRARGVVIVLHDVLWPARVCTHALLLDGVGGARAGLARDVLTQDNLQDLFGCALLPAAAQPAAGFVPAI